MTLLSLIVVLVVLMIVLYVAKSVPAPLSYILYGVIVLVAVVILLQITGVLGGNALHQRLN